MLTITCVGFAVIAVLAVIALYANVDKRLAALESTKPKGNKK